MMKYKELLKQEQEVEAGSILLDKSKTVVAAMDVIDSLSEKQNLSNEYETVMTNKLFSEWLSRESIVHPRTSIEEIVMTEEIMINEQQQGMAPKCCKYC